MKMLESVVELILPMTMANIIDNGIGMNDKNYIIVNSIFLAALSAVAVVFAIVSHYFAAVAGVGTARAIRKGLVEKIQTLSHKNLDEIGSSSLVNRTMSDVFQVQNGVNMTTRLALRTPFLIIGSIVMAMIIDPQLSIIVIAFAPIFVLAVLFVTKKIVPHFRESQKKLDEIAVAANENVAGVREIRAFNESKKQEERFGVINTQWANSARHAGYFSSLLSPLTTLAMNAAILCVIWFGGVRISTNNLSQGELVALIQYLTQIMHAVGAFTVLTTIFSRTFSSASRINEVFEIEPEIRTASLPLRNVRSSSQVANKVVFENVNFGYSEDVLNLHNINLTLKAGNSLGIVSGTGMGKSTLVQLIPRFYDVSMGSVLFDGVDVRSYDLLSLRKKIGIVPQRAVLFSGTLADNLRMGKRDATEEEMLESLRAAQALDFVMRMPAKLDTKISESGKNISGGQRQRLTIARALIRKPELLILDDSASALDYATDAQLRESIFAMGTMSVIVVAQRISAVAACDNIILMEGGRIVASGSHKSLLKSSVLYREIFASQTEGKREVENE